MSSNSVKITEYSITLSGCDIIISVYDSLMSRYVNLKSGHDTRTLEYEIFLLGYGITGLNKLQSRQLSTSDGYITFP